MSEGRFTQALVVLEIQQQMQYTGVAGVIQASPPIQQLDPRSDVRLGDVSR